MLKDGCVAEIGSHAELLQKDDGLYKAMWTLQQQVRFRSRPKGEGEREREGLSAHASRMPENSQFSLILTKSITLLIAFS